MKYTVRPTFMWHSISKLRFFSFQLGLSLLVIPLSAQWTGLAPSPIWTHQSVGIGSATPQKKLQIVSYVTESAGLDNAATLMSDPLQLRLSHIKQSNYNPVGLFQNPFGPMVMIHNFDWDIENSEGVLQFNFTDNLNASFRSPFSLSTSGGIFNYNLSVLGDLNVSGNSTISNLTADDITTGNLTVTNQPTFLNGLKIKNSALQITDANNNVVWNFRADGKLGIGVPSSEMTGPYWLWVKDGIMTERLKVAVKNTADWKDYVFDKNYRLRTLDEVERFIQANKHLPEIPSAEEVVREGIDVQTMDAKLLQKIEELTLYVIELRKEINQLKKKK